MIGVAREIPARRAVDGPFAVELEHIARAMFLARFRKLVRNAPATISVMMRPFAMSATAKRPRPVFERPTRNDFLGMEQMRGNREVNSRFGTAMIYAKWRQQRDDDVALRSDREQRVTFPRYFRTTTGVPSETRPNRSRMSLIVHPDAAIGDEAADRSRRVGAVDGVFADAERHRGRAHRIARRAAADHVRHARLVALDFGRRRPVRTQHFAADEARAGPGFSGAADTDRIGDRLAAAGHVIEPPLVGFDDDRAGRIFV